MKSTVTTFYWIVSISYPGISHGPFATREDMEKAMVEKCGEMERVKIIESTAKETVL